MGLDWASKAGQTAGTWQLDSLTSACDERVDYAGTGDGKRVWVQLVPRGEKTSAVRKSWERVRHFSHPYLIAMYDCGETEVSGSPVDYAVFEPADDNVGVILAGRVLDADEARAMTLAASSALSYLHAQSLSHGAVTASNMFIVGEAVKLSVNTIALANGGGRETDLKQLGMTLVEAMTGMASPEAARSLPKPFRAIARGCLEPERRRWTADKSLDILKGRSQSGINFDLVVQAARRAGEAFAGPGRWAIAAVAALVLLGGVLLYRSASRPPAPVAKLPITIVVPPSRLRPPARKRAPVAGQAVTPGHGPWAVIAATYSNFDSAQGRARQIGRKSPQLRPRVYPPAGRGNRYYVVLGSGMTQKEAEALRRTARQAGAPRDTYVTKLKES